MPHSTKRTREGEAIVVVAARRSKRPIAKNIISILLATVSTQVNTVLVTNTFPCTITGLRWDIGAVSDAGTVNGTCSWAIVKVNDGQAVQNIQGGNGTEFYSPEPDVMAFGRTVMTPANQATTVQWTGSTKSMRKMQGGDTLQFICAGESTNTVEVHGAIQFFCMT